VTSAGAVTSAAITASDVIIGTYFAFSNSGSTNISTITNTSTTAILRLVRDTGAAVATSTDIAQYAFRSAGDASHTLYTGAAIVGVTKEAWTVSGGNVAHGGTALRVETTPTGMSTAARSVVAMFDQDGTFGVGASLTSTGAASLGEFHVTSAGAMTGVS